METCKILRKRFLYLWRPTSRATTWLSVLYAIYSLYVKFWLHSPQGFTALILAITFLSGVNLFFLGIIGEYVGRVYEEAKGRPHYVVRKVTMQSQHSDGVTSQC